MYPTSLVALQSFQKGKYDIYKRVKNTSSRRDERRTSLYTRCVFHMYWQK